MLRGFRDYLLHGKAADLAIAVVLAIAFGDVIRSLVNNIVGPLFGVVGTLGLEDLELGLGNTRIPYGAFLNDLLGFLTVAVAVYLGAVRPLMAARLRSKGPDAPTARCLACLSTIPALASRCAFCGTDRDTTEGLPQEQPSWGEASTEGRSA